VFGYDDWRQKDENKGYIQNNLYYWNKNHPGSFIYSNQHRFLSSNVHRESSNSDDNDDHKESNLKKPSGSSSTTRSQQLTEKREKLAKSTKKGMSRAKELWNKYGIYFLGTYLSVYALFLGGIFIGFDNGILDPSWILTSAEQEDSKGLADIFIDLLEQWEWTQKYAEKIKKSPQLVTFGIAYISNKFTEPVRLGISIYLTPKVARLFGAETLPTAHDEDNVPKKET